MTSTVPRCPGCWRLAVLEVQELRANDYPAPAPFEVYLANLAATHPGVGPFVECESVPLELAGFGSLL